MPELAQRDDKLDRLTNTRQDMLQQKKKEAELHKQRTMQMYDKMAKSAPAGGDKKLDTSVLKPQTTSLSIANNININSSELNSFFDR